MGGMNRAWSPSFVVCVLLGCGVSSAQEAEVVVHAGQASHRVSRYLAGACIEDVNHEIYGGLYSEMIFGESFQEPPPAPSIRNFKLLGGQWTLQEGGVRGSGSDGPKLISDHS